VHLLLYFLLYKVAFYNENIEVYEHLQYFRYKMQLYKEESKEANALGIVVKAHDAI
jgi:hypothetical protein